MDAPLIGIRVLLAMRKGKQLGRYEIVAELGRGAMGVVYKARDPKIDRYVALKTISLAGQEPEAEREYRERFFFEAQAAGRLVHPGIVTIFDVGEEPERRDPYIVMEYIAGQSLAKLLSGEKKKLSFNTALRLTEELAEALDYAHAQGVVHRDMKPANILVTEEGHAKIADFGIAKLNLAHLTVPGQVLGTPAYMSPEQLDGDNVDGRSDLFSLGVILYSMITGYRPFQGNSATTVCFKVANREPVPATALDSELPPELDALLSHAMAKDPAQRYQRGIEFAQDIRELRERRLSQTSSTWLPTATSTVSRTGANSSTRSRTGTSHATQSQPDHGLASVPELAKLLELTRQHWGKAVIAALLVSTGLGLLLRLKPSPAEEPTTVADLAAPVAEHAPKTRFKIYAGRPATVVSSAPANSIAPSSRTARKAAKKARLRDSAESGSSTPAETATAHLRILIEHHFKDAEVSLFVDDKLAYAHTLHGAARKRLIVFGGSVQGNDVQTVTVPAGEHRLRVAVQSGSEALNHSTTILGTFAPDDQRTLRINFDKQRKDMLVALE
jgi:serine/threonine protein kinase